LIKYDKIYSPTESIKLNKKEDWNKKE